MFRLRPALVLPALLAFLLVASGGLQSSPGNGGGPISPPGHAFVPDEILIKFQPNARADEVANARASLGAAHLRTFRSGAEHWRLGRGVGVEQAIARMKGNPHVVYAEPNYILTADLIPDDPRFPEMYGLNNTGQTGGTVDADIDADMAWSVSQGNQNVLVGVIDTGMDYNHPDLAANVWTNPGEIPGNGIDDDANGYVDDIHGYDFYNNDGDPFDGHGHGTHTSGTIGAVGNNGIGVTGVNWHVTIMALKFLGDGGSGSTAGAIAAVEYATMMGVDLTSNSWGGGGYNQALYDAIAEAGTHEIAFIAAAGNDGVNTDTSPHYPSSYDLANIISVAATDHNDARASFSNYGLTSVDLGAPGVNILSTLPGNSYGTASGTSMATPHVAGVAALIRAVNPGIPMAQLKSIIMNSGDPKPSMEGRTVSGKRLNAFFAIAEPDTVPPGMIADLAAQDPTSNTLGLSWTATGDDGMLGTASYYEARYSTAPIDESNFGAATRAGNEPTPAAAGTPQTMEVRGLVASTDYYFAIKAFDEWGNPGPISNLAMGTTLPPPTAQVAPTSVSDSLFTGQMSDHTVVLSNIGMGTLDFTIPTPVVGGPASMPQEPLFLGKDDPDPRSGEPVTLGSGGPDAYGYRWRDSDETGGPMYDWVEIAGTGTAVAATADDSTSPAIPLGFDFPFYGTLFDSIRVCSNGWLSFTSTSTAYDNQPLPTSGAPTNLVAPFWDDLNPGGATHIYFQSFGNRAVVEWTGMPPYNASGTYTFQVILEDTGVITYQYQSMTGAVNNATIGIQDATRTIGLQVAFNQAYLHDSLAVRIEAIPQWLTAAPTSGRILEGQSLPINVHLNAAGLEGGDYPGQVNILTNDPDHPTLTVDVSLFVTGAPDIAVQPASLAYGDSFLGLPKTLSLTVANPGTDVLTVLNIVPSAPELSASPSAFTVPPHGSQNVTVTWTPSLLGPFTGSLMVESNAAGNPALLVPVTGNAIPAPVAVVNPISFEETLLSGEMVTRLLTVTNGGGSPLILSAAADQGPGSNGLVVADETGLGNGGPDAAGMRWWDSDFSGGPIFGWTDISATGTPIAISGDDSLSAAINMGMTFPFYGTNYTSLKVCTNGYITFDTSTTSCAYNNTVLPSTSAAKSMIAMFWDDLHFNGIQRARYLYDGTRFIVQFTDVPRLGQLTTSHLTFQLQLYPNGKILVQHLNMVIPASPYLNSATIGIQNEARTIGLQVVKDAAYVKDELAIQFGRYLDWLTVTPAGATVLPGETASFNVRFNATGRPGGTLSGNVVLGTNIPSQPQILVPSILHVIGRPQISLVPTSHDFGTVFAGYPQLTTFLVVNTGTDVLNVSDVTTTDPYLTAEESPGPGGDEGIQAAFPLPPGGSRVFNLRWFPPNPVILNAEVLVHSDDPETPIAHMPVTGIAIPPPVAVHSPASYTEAVMAGDVLTRTLHLENQGGSDLNFSTALRSLSGTPVPVYDELDLKKDEEDTRPGILGSGGPDLFGYQWVDSDAIGGPSFSFVDISATGTPVTFGTQDDSTSGPIPLGMSFPFYGNTFSQLWVSTNGWASFSAPSSADLSNDPLPNTGAPANLLAAFWDDLHLRSGDVRYLYDGSRFILQYTNVDKYSPSGGSLTFQILLFPNGRIQYQYPTMTSTALNSATIGIQNQSRNDGLTVVYNAAYMHDNLAVEFRPPVDFLSISPTDGTIPPGGFADLEVRIDATHLLDGDYAAAIDLLTNDPARGLITVPVNLHVTGIPDIDAQPPSLTFPTTFVGFSASLPLSVRNVGSKLLQVTGADISGDFAFTGLTPPISIAPGGAVPLTVQFLPTAPGLRTGVLTIHSDDPDEPALTVLLQGEALIPPVIGVEPTSIATALPPGGSRTKTATVCNTGGSDLVWSLGANVISTVVTPYPAMELGKEEVDSREGILGSGGPDTFGYKWKDSDEAGGPVFSFVDISTTGTPIAFDSLDDDYSGPFNLGMSFPFYGNTFSQFWVSTNGWVSFTAPTSSDLSNDPLPNTGAPKNLVALFWDDLHTRAAGNVRYLYDGTRFILQYTDVYRYGVSTGHLTFQVQIYPSGKILLQYLTMNSTRLDEATIGIQNAAGTDGLTVVFDNAYVHDNLAIEIKPIPEWLTASPASGTIPAGGCQAVTLTLNAAGLEDGLHEATLDFSSNDPYNPMAQVPVQLMVGLTPVTYLNFDPDALNISAMGRTVKVVIELPPEYDPHDIDVSTIRLNDTVPAFLHPVDFTDENHNGILELVVKFDRAAVEAVLSPGAEAPVWIQGEVTDVTWFRGTATVRFIQPQLIGPNGSEYFVVGQAVTVTWVPAAWAGNVLYDVYFSRDGGETWEILAENLQNATFTWASAGAPTLQGRIRVFAKDSQGLLGYDTSSADFFLAASLMPPHGIGNTLEMGLDGADVQLTWKRPTIDSTHGPVERYRVKRAVSVQGPFQEIGTVTTESFSDPIASTEGTTVVFYRIVANNGAGDSTE